MTARTAISVVARGVDARVVAAALPGAAIGVAFATDPAGMVGKAVLADGTVVVRTLLAGQTRRIGALLLATGLRGVAGGGQGE
jgi:hypothetical protein